MVKVHKKFKKLLAGVMAVMLLLSMTAIPASASEFQIMMSAEYSRIFKNAINVSVSDAETSSMEIAKLFEQDPYLFLAVLSVEDTVIQQIVVDRLIHAYFFDNIPNLITKIEEVEKSNSLSVAMVQLVNYIYQRADNAIDSALCMDNADAVSPVRWQKLHIPTIKKIIDINLKLDMTDVMFFHKMANTYLLDPSLFAEIISDRSQAEILFLSKAIAYDLHVTGRTNTVMPVVPSGEKKLDMVSDILFTEIMNRENYSLTTILPELSQGKQNTDQRNASGITVSSLTVSSTNPLIYTSVTLGVTVTKSTPPSGTEFYTLKIFNLSVSSTTPIKAQQILITQTNNSPYTEFNITFNEAGNNTLQAKLYDTNGSLVATSPLRIVNVKGEWLIDVSLNENRTFLGTLALFNADGWKLFQCNCLGRSSSGADPSVYEGNTPTGTCVGYIVDEHSNTYSYGPYKRVKLDPISGDIASYTHRWGFMIHGGDAESNTSATWYPLRPTEGCIRISNTSQNGLIQHIQELVTNQNHYELGNVVIWEY